MLNYRDYIDEEKKDIPFSNGMEETVAYICWLDMFLEANESDDDAEHVKNELSTGLQIISRRSMLAKGNEAPLEYGIGITNIAAEYGLKGFGFFCLLLAISPEMDNKYLKIFEEISGDDPGLTIDLAESLYSLMAEDDELMDVEGQINSLLSCPVFTVFPAKRCSGRIGCAFTVSEQVLSVIKGDFVPQRKLVTADEFGVASETDYLRGMLNDEDTAMAGIFGGTLAGGDAFKVSEFWSDESGGSDQRI